MDTPFVEPFWSSSMLTFRDFLETPGRMAHGDFSRLFGDFRPGSPEMPVDARLGLKPNANSHHWQAASQQEAINHGDWAQTHLSSNPCKVNKLHLGVSETPIDGGVGMCLRLSVFARICLRLFLFPALRLLAFVNMCLQLLCLLTSAMPPFVAPLSAWL